MKKFLLYGYGGAYNHGAEAIVKTTIQLIKKKYPDSYIQLVTHFIEQDLEYKMPVDKYFEYDKRYLKLCDYRKVYKNALDAIDEKTICLSVGGDNYCYDNWKKWDCFLQVAKEKGAKSILWSCSIDEHRLSQEMLQSLSMFDIITARERETYKALNNKKEYLKKVQIMLCADVAFLLDKERVLLLKKNKEYIALNVSPLILRTSNNTKVLKENIELVIQYFCENSKFDIMLIPHVLMSTDNDYDEHKQLYDKSKYKDRILLVPANLNCSQYKYLISKCRIGIYSRTHVAIASYSMGVPCVAVGYSIKAKGIAEDFDMEKFLVDNNKIESDDEILSKVQQLFYEEEKIRTQLKLKMPEIKEKALKNMDAI